MVQATPSPLPPACRYVSSAEITSIGSHQFAAGGFSDIWDATLDGRKVALKSYRRYLTSDISEIAKRFCNEVRVCILLHNGDVNVVPFVGIFHTEAHPFCIVYEYVDSLSLKQYLRNKPNARRLKLLAGVAQDLNRMHDLGMVHGRFEATNILVDKDETPRIAGLGNVYILPHSAAWTAERELGTDLLRNRAELTDSMPPTKPGDMCDFGALAFEILTEHPPFSELAREAAMYWMHDGRRPPRPNGGQISDRLWYMIEGCWHITPSQRMSSGEAVDLLKEELRETFDS